MPARKSPPVETRENGCMLVSGPDTRVDAVTDVAVGQPMPGCMYKRVFTFRHRFSPGATSATVNRRQLLRAIGVGATGSGLAGCNTGLRGPTGTPTGSRTPTRWDGGPTATPIEEDPPTYGASGSRTVELAGDPFVAARVDSMPKPVPFQPWIELLEQPSRTREGRIRVGMTNRADRSYALYGVFPHPMAGSRSESRIAVGEYDGSTQDGCPRELRRVGESVSGHQWVKPHFGISTTHAIFVTHEKDVCFPEGKHRFTGHREVYGDPADDEPLLAFEWAFSLIVQ
jgi:hypothetical protein